MDRDTTVRFADGHRTRYAFIAHWVEHWNWWLWWSDDLHRHPEHAWRWVLLTPITVIAGICYAMGRKAYDVVDSFLFNGNLKGEIILIRAFALHFLPVLRMREKIRQRILRAVLDAQMRGIQVVGLGALCKDEGLTRGGEWIVEQLGNRLQVPILHGDTLTVAAVFQRARQLIQMFGLEGQPIMMTGATSKIGRAIVLEFARRGIRVLMCTNSMDRFKSIQAEAGDNGHLLCRMDSLRAGAEAGLWLTGKADLGAGKRLITVLSHGTVVLNFAVPDPLHPSLLKRRPDIRHFDGGLMGFDPEKTNLRFNMRLRPGLTYACHAGTIVHAAMGWTHHEVGQVHMDQLGTVWNAALECGFDLPPLTSFLRPVQGVRSTETQQPLPAAGRWWSNAAIW